MISFVVAKSQNNVIGSNNDLPWYLPADLKHFKNLTIGKTVVMGRKTFDSIVARNGKPLPGRTNVVLTRQKDFSYPDVTVMHNVNDISADDEIYVIGGAEIFQNFMLTVNRMYITEIKADIEGDVHFPSIDSSEWHEVSRESHFRDEKNSYDYDFVIYERL